MRVEALSYAAGGIAFLVLTLLLLTSWRGRLRGVLVVLAALMTTVWCAVLAYQLTVGRTLFIPVFTSELLRDAAWLTLLLALLGAGRGGMLPLWAAGVTHAAWIALLLYVVAGALGAPLLALETVVFIGPLLLALAGLVLVEQLYRNTEPGKRWAVKHFCLGIGAIFAYDFFLYSQGLLLRQLDITLWSARGAVNALVAPLIAVSAARNPEWSLNVFVSRHVVFYSASLIAAGVYLLAMAAGGYYIRVYGGSWGAIAEVVFLVGAVLVLATIMLSTDARSQAKVFLVKHFYKNKYDYREEWLRLIATITTPSDELPLRGRTIKAVAQIVGSPGGMLWLRGADPCYRPAAQWRMSALEELVEPADSPFARFLNERQWVIDVSEHGRDPEWQTAVPLPSWLSAIDGAWLLIPLMREERLLGFMLLARSSTFGRLTWEDTDLLKTVGRQVASYLADDEAAQQLAEAKQFDAYHRLTAFIMHDLKNLIAQQSLVVKNAARHRDNPAFVRDAIATIENSVQRMNQLLIQLKRGQSHGNPSRVALHALVEETVAKHAGTAPAPRLQAQAPEVEAWVEREGLAAVLSHLIRNAQEATPADGSVQVHLRREADEAVIEVIDDGCGMEPSFVRDRLFRPFDSTKGSKGMGIGAYQAREFIRAAGGEVLVTSAPGKGTTFKVSLPALPAIPSGQAFERLKAQG